MATETNQPQGKILFKRTDIVTMKKDIKMLREVDLHKESEKILAPNITQAVAQPTKQPNILNVPIQEKVVEQLNKQDNEKMAKARPYALENEKQQIFALESQLTDIKNQLQTLGGEQEPSLNLEKNQILLKQTSQKDALESLIKEEEKIDQEIAVVEKSAKEITAPADRQHLEKERAAMENRRQEVEKKRWAVEQDVSKLDEQMKALETNYKGFGDQETTLKEKMASINDSLRTIYAGIIDRENSKPKMPQQPAPAKAAEKPAFAGSSGMAKENEQRRKFMEDIEAWANSSDKK